MFTRASFQAICYQTEKVYSVYNPSPEEKASFMAKFQRTAQIGETYLLSEGGHQQLVLKLFVHNYWVERTFTIDSILEKNGLKLSHSDVKTVCEALKGQQYVMKIHKDILSNTWSIPDQEQMLLVDKIKNILGK